MLHVLKKTDETVSGNSINDNRERSWLSSRIERGRKEVFSEVVAITPGIAKHIMEANADNRTLRNSAVWTIANDIENGRWQMNGEPIIVAQDGFLNDGQHRLSGIIESGKTVEAIVTFGVSRDSRFTLDLGRSRTVGDHLGMEGAHKKERGAAIARLYCLYRRGLYQHSAPTAGKSSNALTKAEIRAEYWRFHKDIESALHATDNKFLQKWGVTAAAVAYIICSNANKEAAEIFFIKLKSGADLKQSDPILFLRAQMMIAVNGKSMRANAKLELILRHWNAWRSGRRLSAKIKIVGSYPKVEV